MFTQDDLKMLENENGSAAYFATRDREVNLILTSLYMVIEVARRQEAIGQQEANLKKEIGKQDYKLLFSTVPNKLFYNSYFKTEFAYFAC